MYIYILEYINENFFVGATNNLENLYPKFKCNVSKNEWLQNKIFVGVKEVIEIASNEKWKKYKNYYCVKYMSEYGIDKVRGGRWTKFYISGSDYLMLDNIVKEINYNSDITEISLIYEREFAKIKRQMAEISSISIVLDENFLEFECNYINCPLCRSKTSSLKNPRLIKGLENFCSICLTEKCQIICDSCDAPFSCSKCYNELCKRASNSEV